MQRTDRLFEIIDILRAARGPVTAAVLAERLEVTPRTIYRYIATLQAMRIPIEGEAGIGYIMRRGYNLPPLNFGEEELEAIVVGLRLLQRTGDKGLQSAAHRVLDKIETHRLPVDGLRVSNWGIENTDAARLAELRLAIREERELSITYRALDDAVSSRKVLPLLVTYYLEVAVLMAWCGLRNDFRHFRIDRIEAMAETGSFFSGRGNTLRAEFEKSAPVWPPLNPT